MFVSPITYLKVFSKLFILLKSFSRWGLNYYVRYYTWRGSCFLKPSLNSFANFQSTIQSGKNTTVKGDVILTRTMSKWSVPILINSLFEAVCNLIIYYFHAICSSKLKKYYHVCVKHEEKNYRTVNRWSTDRQKWGTERVKSPHEHGNYGQKFKFALQGRVVQSPI